MARNRRGSFQRGSVSGVEVSMKNLRIKSEKALAAAKAALRDGVDLIVSDAKSRCPVETGRLRNSIKAVDIAEGMAYELTADAKNDRGIPYGQFVEFDPRINRPFLYPALDANLRSVKAGVKAAIQDAVRQGGAHGNSAA